MMAMAVKCAKANRMVANVSRPLLPHRKQHNSLESTLFRPTTRCICGGGCPRCLSAIQAKLSISEPGDRYEREADRIADQVMGMPEPAVTQAKSISPTITPLLQRQEEAEEEEALVQSKASCKQPPRVDQTMAERIRALRGGGQPLSLGERAFFEPRFDRDFRHIRLHNTSSANELAQGIKAKAFTLGSDIVFNRGQYASHSVQGKQLLAHELVHSIQQQSTGVKSIQRKCDPALVSSRTRPLYFPISKALMAIFTGNAAIKKGDKGYVVGLIQQALVDLNYKLGNTGPGGYGVDKRFGKLTENAVKQFQVDEKISSSTPGTVDKRTLKCLDEVRTQKGVVFQTKPLFFPQERTLMQVFSGARKLAKGSIEWEAVGLIQQALVDLGYLLGSSGRHRDGVDGSFGKSTYDAVELFQFIEPIIPSTFGVVDSVTLRHLDKLRARKAMQPHLKGKVAEEQYQIRGRLVGGKENEIFFPRGATKPNPAQEFKIPVLAKKHQCHSLLLSGFISEDERLDFGDKLARIRAQYVSKALLKAGHGDAKCPSTNRTLVPKPEAGMGLMNYRKRRKVEVTRENAPVSTVICSGPGRLRPARKFNAVEKPIVKQAIKDGVAFMNTAIGHLTAKDKKGKDALEKFFDGANRRKAVKWNLGKWRNHLKNRVPKRIRRGTACDSSCGGNLAYNVGKGWSARMTICDDFFAKKLNEYSGLNNDKQRALILIHEAGHGSLDTEDYAYDTRRLIHFIAKYWRVARKNTDSYVTLIRFLTGLISGAAFPARKDIIIGFSGKNKIKDKLKAQEGVAWLESWLIWTEQTLNDMYSYMVSTRKKGKWTDSYYRDYGLKPIESAFKLRRHKGALPTLREQMLVAAVWDRYNLMKERVRRKLIVRKDTSPFAVSRWKRGTGQTPGNEVFLNKHYFSLNARQQVELLLPLIIAAMPTIASSLRATYVKVAKEIIKDSWGDNPKSSP